MGILGVGHFDIRRRGLHLGQSGGEGVGKEDWQLPDWMQGTVGIVGRASQNQGYFVGGTTNKD